MAQEELNASNKDTKTQASQLIQGGVSTMACCEAGKGGIPYSEPTGLPCLSKRGGALWRVVGKAFWQIGERGVINEDGEG